MANFLVFSLNLLDSCLSVFQDCTAKFPLVSVEGDATPIDDGSPLVVEKTTAGSFSRPKIPIQVQS